MQQNINPPRIANKILMLRGKEEYALRSFVLVEGSTDNRVYGKIFCMTYCQIETCYNKLNALEVLGILESRNTQGILAIIDADFDRLDNKVYTSSNILFTDTHDLETMLIKSPALEDVLRENSSQEKIINLDVRCMILKSSSVIGCLRWLSLQKGYSLKFQEMDFSNFIEQSNLEVNKLKLIRYISSRSQPLNIPDSQLLNELKSLEQRNPDSWQVSCGHDMVNILGFGLRRVLGTNAAQDVKSERLEKELRLAYNYAYFNATELYSGIIRWEQNNHPYRILANVNLPISPL